MIISKRVKKIQYKLYRFLANRITYISNYFDLKAESLFFDQFTEEEMSERRKSAMRWIDSIP